MRESERERTLRDERMLTTREVAHVLGMSEVGVRKWLRKGHLPGYRLGDVGNDRTGWRVAESELRAWLATRRGELTRS